MHICHFHVQRQCSTKNSHDNQRIVQFVQSTGTTLKTRGKLFVLFTLTTDSWVNFYLGEKLSLYLTHLVLFDTRAIAQETTTVISLTW